MPSEPAERTVDAYVSLWAAETRCLHYGRIALSWWDGLNKQRIQGLFREAIAEIGATAPPEVPKGYSVYSPTPASFVVCLNAPAGPCQRRGPSDELPAIRCRYAGRGDLGSFA